MGLFFYPYTTKMIGLNFGLAFELNIALDFTIVAILAWQNALYRNALAEIKEAYYNDNFGCLNRAGAIALGNKFLKDERRRIKSGELVMIAIDIAGMGQKNSQIGEEAVNQAITESLNEIKKFREIEFISQKNSGDEFCLISDSKDVAGIISRIDAIFKYHGFSGVYAATAEICGDYMCTAARAMEKVYKIKMDKKNGKI